MLKKILNCLIIFFIGIILGTMIITLFNYFNILDSKIIKCLKFMLPSIMIFISSYRLGGMSNKKGYLEGLKLSSIIVLILFLLVLLLDKICIRSIFYYFILILFGVMGSMIGINRKKSNA